MVLTLASCTHDIVAVDRADMETARDLDILFVFDDSSDRANFNVMESQLADLRDRLSSIDGQLPSLHVGVVTGDLGTRGTQDTGPGPTIANCVGEANAGKLVKFSSGIDDAFLEDLRGADGERIRNFDSDNLVLELGLLTNPLGQANAGCHFQQPLEAMRRALDPETNPDFIRPDALLSIVFLTTDDDCSLARGAMLDANDGSLGPLSFRCTEQGVICDGDDPRRPGARTNCRPRDDSEFMVDVSEYQTFLEQLKPDPSDVVVSAVAGSRDPFVVQDFGAPVLGPSCQGPAGSARPAVRIGALVDSFGGSVVDVCTQNAASQRLARPIVGPQRACFVNLRVTDGEDCTVIEAIGDTETELSKCADDSGNGPLPCWYTYADAGECPAGDNIGIAVNRGTKLAPVGARVEATCLVK